MPIQKHTPEEKDRMVAEIDALRQRQGYTLDRACDEVGPKYGKSGHAMLSMYNYWKAVRAGKSYMKRSAAPKKAVDIAEAISAAIKSSTTGPPTRVNEDVRSLKIKYLRQMLELLDEVEEKDTKSDLSET